MAVRAAVAPAVGDRHSLGKRRSVTGPAFTSVLSFCLTFVNLVGASKFLGAHIGNRAGSARWLQRILYVTTRKSMAVFGASDIEHLITRGEAGRRRLPRPLLLKEFLEHRDASKKEVAARVPIQANECDIQRKLANKARAPRPRCARLRITGTAAVRCVQSESFVHVPHNVIVSKWEFQRY